MQRGALSQHLAPLGQAFDFGARVSGLLQDAKAFVMRHPVAIAVAVAAVVVFKPAAVLRWSQRGLLAWRTWRGVRALLPGFLLERLRGKLGPGT